MESFDCQTLLIEQIHVNQNAYTLCVRTLVKQFSGERGLKIEDIYTYLCTSEKFRILDDICSLYSFSSHKQQVGAYYFMIAIQETFHFPYNFRDEKVLHSISNSAVIHQHYITVLFVVEA